MNAIEINDLCWKYDGADEFIFDGLNLSIPEGVFCGIVGSNESGKTTLVECMKGLIPNAMTGVYRGEVKLFGETVMGDDKNGLPELSGIVFCDPDAQFTTMSVVEEIAFGLENLGVDEREIGRRIQWVVGLCHLDGLLDKPPFDLSGGQKQRVAIAAVLATKPRAIILDEPTSMLDPKSKDEIFNILQSIKEELNITVIVVEHNIEKIAELADEVILMGGGKVLRHEKTPEFFKAVDLLEKNSLEVPETIKLEYYLYDKLGIDRIAPVHFDEAVAEIKSLLDDSARSSHDAGRSGSSATGV